MEINADTILTNWANKYLAASLPPAPAGREWWTIAGEARDFALAAHHGQTRKGTEEPYFLHLAEVAMIVWGFAERGLMTAGEASLAIAVAWLHDSVEDCGVNRTVIEKQFGPQVARSVDALTKRPKGPAMLDSMGDSLARIALDGRIASLVKIADRISNLSWTPPANWPSRQVRLYGQEGRHIAATLHPHLPREAALALQLVADAYLKRFGSLGGPGARKP